MTKFFKQFIFTLSLLFCFSFLVLPLRAEAVDLGNGILSDAQVSSGYGTADSTTFAEMVGNVVKTAMSFLGVIFIALMVYGGFLWMTARGEETQVTKAKDLIRAALIGLIIVISAYSISNFVVTSLISTS
ncbi:hypothetical protein KJ641_04560 [Patescibacteria group bacterium]|nr:hypothetical protein [Patescibacteria group bacterium]MBU1896107.1 hypothetical protein [Patescibacteria group bacterium]